MTMTWDGFEAAGLCECGQALDGHPPLGKPRDWGHGRPCSRTALDRGHGWDGRPAPDHAAGVRARWSTDVHPSGEGAA